MKNLQEKQKSATLTKLKLESSCLRASQWQQLASHCTIREGFEQDDWLSAWTMLKRSDIDFGVLEQFWSEFQLIPQPIKRYLKSEALYTEQVKKQQSKINLLRKEESLTFPQQLDFSQFGFLSDKEKEKLTRHKPRTLGQAMRIEGITPTSVILLHSICKKEQDVKHSEI